MNRELQVLLMLPKVVMKWQQCTASIGINLQVSRLNCVYMCISGLLSLIIFRC